MSSPSLAQLFRKVDQSKPAPLYEGPPQSGRLNENIENPMEDLNRVSALIDTHFKTQIRPVISRLGREEDFRAIVSYLKEYRDKLRIKNNPAAKFINILINTANKAAGISVYADDRSLRDELYKMKDPHMEIRDRSRLMYDSIKGPSGQILYAKERTITASCLDKEFEAIRKKLKHTRDFSDADMKRILKRLDIIQDKYHELEKNQPEDEKEAANPKELYEKEDPRGIRNPLHLSHGAAYKEFMTLLDWYKDVVIRTDQEQRENVSSLITSLWDLEEKSTHIIPEEIENIKKEYRTKVTSIKNPALSTLAMRVIATSSLDPPKIVRDRERLIQNEIDQIYKSYGTTREEVKAQRAAKKYNPLPMIKEEMVRVPIEGVEREAIEAVKLITNMVRDRIANLSKQKIRELGPELIPYTKTGEALASLIRNAEKMTNQRLLTIFNELIRQSNNVYPIYKDFIAVMLDSKTAVEDKRKKLSHIISEIKKGNTETLGYIQGNIELPDIQKEFGDLGITKTVDTERQKQEQRLQTMNKRFEEFMTHAPIKPGERLAAQYALNRIAYALQIL